MATSRRSSSAPRKSALPGRPTRGTADGHDLLDEIAGRCRSAVRRKALLSAAGAAVPVPGVGLAVDLGVLMQMLDETNEAFGLTPEQIDRLSPERRLRVHRVIERLGASVAGRAVTREVLLTLLRSASRRLVARTSLKVIPLAGPLIAAALSYSVVRLIGERHVSQCLAASRQLATIRSPRRAR
jgi:uncharacterized protein (DUF697 family)